MKGRHPAGHAQIPDSQIEDADFVEIEDGDANAETLTAQPQFRGNWGFWKIFAVAFCTMLVWMLFVAVLRSVGAWPLFHISRPEPSAESEARQMLADWPTQVTGNVREHGFYMIDGSGSAGSSCDSGNGTQMLKFGGMQLGGAQGTAIDDYFSMAMTKTKTMIAGAYWFDPAARTITIRNAKIFDLNANPRGSMRDSVIKVEPNGTGIIGFRGAQFHVCELSQPNQ